MLAEDLPRLDSAQIVKLRPPTDRPSAGHQPLAFWLEREARQASEGKEAALVLTVLLRGSECRFRCLMCDLWKGTHREPTAPGALVAQVQQAIEATAEHSPSWIKLYNAANFFANVNVPVEDLAPLAACLKPFERVVVENHPKLLPNSITTFERQLTGRLEVAMGLETIHPQVLPKLNKQMTQDDFAHACHWLQDRDIDVRAFVLLRPPGLDESLGRLWCHRTIDFARSLAVRHISVIPLRGGNGAIEFLAASGFVQSPQARSLECVVNDELQAGPAEVITADLWDWPKLRGHCERCARRRQERLEKQNLEQAALPQVPCNCLDVQLV